MSKDLIIYHNPRCSKSRQTLELIRERGAEPRVVEYLEEPLKAGELRRLLKLLGLSAHGFVRTKEPDYREAGLSPDSTEDEIIDAIEKYPRLLERPIVVHGDKAALGRPPESVLKIL